jgi:hypothetical protein
MDATSSAPNLLVALLGALCPVLVLVCLLILVLSKR